MAMVYHLLLSPSAALALEEIKTPKDTAPAIQLDKVVETPDDVVPEPEPEKVILTPIGVKGISAYNVGDPSQTDDSPCISASGENVCLALESGQKRCAANFVPFGTELEIEGFGRCIVTDRMNSRYKNHVDIAMKKTEKKEALKFGRKKLNVRLVKKVAKI